MGITRREFVRLSAATGATVGLSGSLGSALARQAAASGGAPAGGAKRLLILGGTAFLGPEIVGAAKQRGWTITLFNRGKTHPEFFPELEKLRGDRKNDLKSLEGRDWDYCVDTSGYVPRHVRDSATLLRDHVKQYVFISTISVYGESVPKIGTDENDPTGALPEGTDPTTEAVSGATYGPLKALCEKAAEDSMPGRVTNIRPGLIVGPNDPTDRFTYWPVRVAKGGDVLCPGTPNDPVQVIDVRDLAEWTVQCLERGLVGVYNATGPEGGMPIGQMLEACKHAAGPSCDAKFLWGDAKFLEEQKVGPWQDMPTWVPPDGEMAGFSRIAVGKAIAAGLKFRPIEDTARDTLAWWRTLPAERQAKLKAGISAEREAAALAALKARG